MNNTSRLTIWLINGEVQFYDFEPRDDGQRSTAGRIAKIFEAGCLRIRVADTLVVIPNTSILRVEMSPAPDDLLDPIARRVETDQTGAQTASAGRVAGNAT